MQQTTFKYGKETRCTYEGLKELLQKSGNATVSQNREKILEFLDEISRKRAQSNLESTQPNAIPRGPEKKKITRSREEQDEEEMSSGEIEGFGTTSAKGMKLARKSVHMMYTDICSMQQSVQAITSASESMAVALQQACTHKNEIIRLHVKENETIMEGARLLREEAKKTAEQAIELSQRSTEHAMMLAKQSAQQEMELAMKAAQQKRAIEEEELQRQERRLKLKEMEHNLFLQQGKQQQVAAVAPVQVQGQQQPNQEQSAALITLQSVAEKYKLLEKVDPLEHNQVLSQAGRHVALKIPFSQTSVLEGKNKVCAYDDSAEQILVDAIKDMIIAAGPKGPLKITDLSYACTIQGKDKAGRHQVLTAAVENMKEFLRKEGRPILGQYARQQTFEAKDKEKLIEFIRKEQNAYLNFHNKSSGNREITQLFPIKPKAAAGQGQ